MKCWQVSVSPQGEQAATCGLSRATLGNWAGWAGACGMGNDAGLQPVALCLLCSQPVLLEVLCFAWDVKTQIPAAACNQSTVAETDVSTGVFARLLPVSFCKGCCATEVQCRKRTATMKTLLGQVKCVLLQHLRSRARGVWGCSQAAHELLQ